MCVNSHSSGNVDWISHCSMPPIADFIPLPYNGNALPIMSVAKKRHHSIVAISKIRVSCVISDRREWRTRNKDHSWSSIHPCCRNTSRSHISEMDCPSYMPRYMGPGLCSFYPDLHQQEQQCLCLVSAERRADHLPQGAVLPTRDSKVAAKMVNWLEGGKYIISRLLTQNFVVREYKNTGIASTAGSYPVFRRNTNRLPWNEFGPLVGGRFGQSCGRALLCRVVLTLCWVLDRNG